MRGITYTLCFALLLSVTPVARAQSARAASKTGGDWLAYGLTQSEARFSPLDEINASNVSRLRPAWSYDLGTGGGNQEATPLVRNGTLYGITNWSVVFAVDARTGKERWRWDPEVNQDAVFQKICCGVVNRGIAIYQNLIIAPVIDGRLEALNAETGKPVWEARVAYPQDWYTITMAPRIAKDKVVVGVSGGDKPTRGFFAAFDAMTGRLAWKFYTVPGDPSKPFENSAMRKASATWDGNFWKMGGGGAVWDGMAFDPDVGLVYVGTGNAEPWPEGLRQQKGKDNLYVCSILAVQVDTGELRWHYQVVPGDSWDFDSVQQLTLADLTVKGRPHKVIMQANKDGFFYVIDRLTGEFLSAGPFTQVNWAKGIDPKTGRPIVNPQAHYGSEAVTIMPGGGGGHNWAPMSFNPNTGLMYIPTSTNNSWTYASEEVYNPRWDWANGTVRGAKAVRPSPPTIGPAPLRETGPRGALVAWNPVSQQMAWRMPGGGGIGGGTVTTAGNLVFQVLNDGHLLAYSADKGEKLLDVDTGLRSGMGPPITYSVDAKQYVAVMGGMGTVRPRPNATAPVRPPVAPKLLSFVLDGNAGSASTGPALSPDAAAVLDLEKKIGEAIVHGDVAFFDRVTTDDFIMTHSDRWTTGGKPLLVDDKASFRKRIENRSYLSYDLDSEKVEMHGNIAITYGRYVASMRNTPPERMWFSVWFEKVYEKRDGQWMYVSHKTVNGANYGPDRASVSNK